MREFLAGAREVGAQLGALVLHALQGVAKGAALVRPLTLLASEGGFLLPRGLHVRLQVRGVR